MADVDTSLENDFYQKKKAAKRTLDFEYLKEKYKDASRLDDVEFDYFRTPNNGAVNVTAKDVETGRPLYRARFMPEGDKSKPQAWVLDAMQSPYFDDERFVASKDIFKKMQQDFIEGNIEGGIDAPIKTTKPSNTRFGAGKPIDYSPFIDAEETNVARLGKKITSSTPAVVKNQAKESVIDATSRFGKKAGKELLGAIPLVGGLASAALSGDASAGVPLLEEAEPVGMTGAQENEMLLNIEEQKAKSRYEQSPAGQAAQQRNVMRGPASVEMPESGGATFETNEDQALRLMGLKGNGAERATSAANAYLNRNKPAIEAARIPASPDVSAQPQTAFVEQRAPVVTPIANQVKQGPATGFDLSADLPRDLRVGLDEQRKAYMEESDIYRQQGEQIANAEAQFNRETEQELEQQKNAKELETQVANDVDERSRMRLEPKNFFAGKNTWQKVMGGLGLFLSSFSKEGAARFAEAVDRDIELDLKAQESAILAKDKSISDKQSLVKQYFDQYKDLKAARLMARADAFNMIKLRAESAASSTKSRAAAGAARQAVGLAELEINKAKQAAMAQLLKAQAAQDTKSVGRSVNVLGFEGLAPTEGEAKEFRTLGGEAKTALDSIDQLKTLSLKGSKVSLQDQAKAETIARLLGASLRTTVVGQGAVSDAERKILEDIAANPLKIFSLQTTQLARLDQLKKQVVLNLKNKAQTIGIEQRQIGTKAGM